MSFVFVAQKKMTTAFYVVTRTACIKGFTLFVSLSLNSLSSRGKRIAEKPYNLLLCQIMQQLNVIAICICKGKPTPTDKLGECHGESCKNGKYFHLACLDLQRMPNNHRTTSPTVKLIRQVHWRI